MTRRDLREWAIEVDSPKSRRADWEDYCNADDLPPTIRSRGDADDCSETWLVYARTQREAVARARQVAARRGINVLTEVLS